MLNKSNTFRKNLLLFVVPILIPLLILGTFSIIITRHYIQERINNNNSNALRQTQRNLELIFDELDSIHLNLGVNPEIVVSLKKIFDSPDDQANYEEYRLLTTFANIINAPASARPYIHSIYVYFDNDQRKLLTTTEGLTYLDRFKDQLWYRSFLANQSNDKTYWSEPRRLKDYAFEKTPTQLWTIYRKIYATSGYKKCIGVIVLNIYSDYLTNIVNQSETVPNQTFLIADEVNRVIYSSSPTPLPNAWIDRTRVRPGRSTVVRDGRIAYAVSAIDSPKYRLRYFSVIPLKTLYKVPNELQTMTLLLLAISFALSLILTYYLTRRNYNQINEIVTILDSAASGRPLPPPAASGDDEYRYITHTILKTFLEQNYLKMQLSERKYRLQVMEFLALQSQINPHFLFNTLETIRWRTIQYTAKPNEASKMLENLADILHYSLEAPGRAVTIAEEIHNTRNYIEIQRNRYCDKFDLIWQYDEEVKSLKTIRLILQPLLENSIYHGIKEKEGGSIIKITIRRRGAQLAISVVDNGLGMTAAKLNALRAKLRDESAGANIGLFNTNKRLILTYGATAALKIRSKPGRGTVVFFQIPATEADFATPERD